MTWNTPWWSFSFAHKEFETSNFYGGLSTSPISCPSLISMCRPALQIHFYFAIHPRIQVRIVFHPYFCVILLPKSRLLYHVPRYILRYVVFPSSALSHIPTKITSASTAPSDPGLYVDHPHFILFPQSRYSIHIQLSPPFVFDFSGSTSILFHVRSPVFIIPSRRVLSLSSTARFFSVIRS